MPPKNANDTALVVAAQGGDRRALNDLIEAYLPFVYTIVRRTLADDADVDDVVQESLLRAVRELRALRTPETFRAWLGAITVRQVSTHLRRRRVTERRTAELAEASDAGAAFEGLTVMRLAVAQQRRQAARAAQWLQDDERILLSLWWLEVAGYLTRAELATAAGISLAHAAVRVQRMRRQFDQCRALVAALDARPRCADLGQLVTEWDGVPAPLWRKRIARHLQGCGTCTGASGGLLAAERLLVGLALLPVPLALGKAVAGNGATVGVTVTSSAALSGAAKPGVAGLFTKVLSLPAIAMVAVTGFLIGGTTLVATTWPAAGPGPRSAAPSPTRSSAPRLLTLGPTSLEAEAGSGLFVTTAATLGVLAPLSGTSSASARQQATFDVVPGLADPKCFSFRSRDGRYLRHASWRLRLNAHEGTTLFQGDATFCVRPGPTASSVQLESANYPGWLLRRRGSELWVDRSDGTAAFHADSAFRVRPPLAE